MIPSIYYVIITYKPRKEKIRGLLRVLCGRNVIISDNTPEGYPFTSPEKGSHVVIHNFRDLGYGAGANVGIREALKRKAEWVVILNDDLKMTQNTLSHFEAYALKGDPCIAGPFAGYFDRKRYTTILNLSGKPVKNPDYMSGSFLAIHKDVISRIGLFDERYFIYYDDARYCLSALRVGFPLKQIILPGIYHKDATNVGENSWFHQYYLARNHMLFVEQSAPIGVKLHEVLRMPKTLWEHMSKNETGALAGIGDYAVRRFGLKEENT